MNPVVYVLRWFAPKKPRDLRNETPLARMAIVNINQTTITTGKK